MLERRRGALTIVDLTAVMDWLERDQLRAN
jgi:hypothetical protein